MTGIEIGVAVVVGVLLGRLLPDRRKGPKPAKAPEPVCGCEHHHSFHEDGTGKCAHVRQHYRGNGLYVPVGCTCMQYSGPQPMPEYYAPEITS